MSSVMAPEKAPKNSSVKAPGKVPAADLAVLRARVRALESGGSELAVQPLGLPALDRRLPGGGLALGVLHQVEGRRAEWDDAPAAGFCLALIAPIMKSHPGASGGMVVWVTRRDDLHGRGLAALGLDPARFLLVRADDDQEVLWAMEEALKCRSVLAVVGEAAELEPSAGRRLQLAAEARSGERGGVTAFLLRRRFGPPRRAEPPSAAHTRWCVASAPSAPVLLNGVSLPELPGRPRWQVELKRCRGAAPGNFIVEWDDASGDFAMAAALCDGPARTAKTAGIGRPRRTAAGFQEEELRRAS